MSSVTLSDESDENLENQDWWPSEPTLVTRTELAELVGINSLIDINTVYYRCDCSLFELVIQDIIESNTDRARPFFESPVFRKNLLRDLNRIHRTRPRLYRASSADVDFSGDTVSRRMFVKAFCMHWTSPDTRTYTNIFPVGAEEFKTVATIEYLVNDDRSYLHLEFVMKFC